MRRMTTMRDRVFAIASGLRTPDTRTSRLSTRPASIGRRLLPLLIVSALLMTGCEEAPVATGPEAPPEITVLDAAGITTLREQAAAEGKVLVVDCWATWCGSCVAMFPHLHKAMKERGDGVMLVSLSFDEGEEDVEKAGAFLTKRDAWEGAFRATEGSDAKDAIAKALTDNWDGGVLPAVFVYKPDGTTAYELLETRGTPKDWVQAIGTAVDESLQNADASTGQ